MRETNLVCVHCWEPIDPDALWPDNGVHDDGLDFHDGCLDAYRSERAAAFRARIETLPPSRVGREDANGDTRVTGRPALCICEEMPEQPCPVHEGSGRWAR